MHLPLIPNAMFFQKEHIFSHPTIGRQRHQPAAALSPVMALHPSRKGRPAFRKTFLCGTARRPALLMLRCPTFCSNGLTSLGFAGHPGPGPEQSGGFVLSLCRVAATGNGPGRPMRCPRARCARLAKTTRAATSWLPRPRPPPFHAAAQLADHHQGMRVRVFLVHGQQLGEAGAGTDRRPRPPGGDPVAALMISAVTSLVRDPLRVMTPHGLFIHAVDPVGDDSCRAFAH